MLNLYCLKLLYTAWKFNVRSNKNLDPKKVKSDLSTLKGVSLSTVAPFLSYFFQNSSLVGAMFRDSVGQWVSEVCLFVTPIRFQVLSEPIKLQFIKAK